MASQAQSHPTLEDARELFEWQPPLGVLSVYLRIDPGDRRGAWRTELKKGLAEVLKLAEGGEHETRVALRSTADRVSERFAERELDSLPRGEAGFVEVAREPAGERRWSTHLAPRAATSVHLDYRPVLVPFLHLAAQGCPCGIALVSAERVRLLQWQPGQLEELQGWELNLLSGDWRERKAPVSPNPAHAQGVSAAGRDQYNERLSENRNRFLRECGRRIARIAAERGWAEVIAFSPPQYADRFGEAFHSAAPELVLGGEVDLIAESVGELLKLVEEAVERQGAERDRRLVERALEEARAGAHAVAGAPETMAALEQARVEHLILDDARGLEPLARGALATGARITPVSGEAADLIAPADGVAALLRY